MHNMSSLGFSLRAVLALSLVHDVSEFCIAQGSTVFDGSLDTEGTFDNIPFPF